MPAVSVIVLARHGGIALARTLDGIARQSPSGISVFVAAVASRARHVRAIRAIAEPRQARVRGFAALPLGSVLNAACAEQTADLLMCLEEGDELPPGFASAAAAVLGSGACYAAAPMELVAGFDTVATSAPTALTLVDALASPRQAPSAGAFGRNDWERVGGFDGALPALVRYDFLLRLLAEGRPAVVVDALPLRRSMSATSIHRDDFDPAAHAAALRVILAKHRKVLEADPSRVLVDRERESANLLARHHALVHRRDEAVRLIAAAQAECAELAAFLRGHARQRIDWGDLRSGGPLSRDWGYDRGTPLDRVFIEQFVAANAADVRGAVLEVQEADLTKRFGGGAVTRSDVVDIEPSNEQATIIADLRHASAIPDDAYDCIILTQTLHVIDDWPAVLRECRRVLKPGGVLLATVPAASRVCVEYGRDGDFWRCTEAGARRLFSAAFDEGTLETRSFGNVLTTTAFLQGAAAHELAAEEYDKGDPAYPTLIGIRAIKRATAAGSAARAHVVRTPERGRAAILLYHRVAPLDDDVYGLAIPPDVFAAQIELIGSKYVPLGLDDVLDASAQRRLPHRSVAVTFDDAYVDNLSAAAPILAAAHIPAAFFATTRPLTGGLAEFWWDALARLVPDGPSRAEWYERLVRCSADEIQRGIEELRQRERAVRPADSGGSRPMTRDELLTLAASRAFTIGAHGVDHLYLPAQTAGLRQAELWQSRRDLEDLLGRDVRWLAYPFGAHDGATRDAAREAGFEGALTCEPRALREGDGLYAVPRIEVRSRSLREFEQLLVECFR